MTQICSPPFVAVVSKILIHYVKMEKNKYQALPITFCRDFHDNGVFYITLLYITTLSINQFNKMQIKAYNFTNTKFNQIHKATNKSFYLQISNKSI